MRLRYSLCLVLLLSSCAGLKLKLVNHAVRKPSNVAVYFSVDRRGGDGVPGLTADNFRIYENGGPISKLESKQTIVNPQVTAAHYTLLLIDMSGSVTGSGQLPLLQEATDTFTSRVEKYQRVGVYAFDGSPNLSPIVGFTSSGGSAASGVKSLSRLRSRDPSTNLHGAVVEAIRTLNQALAQAPQPLKFGTLVVFTDGTDRANRVSQREMMDAVGGAPYDVFVIGVGGEIDAKELSALGRTGVVLDANTAALTQAFDGIAKRIESFTQRYYLLSYCSPARAGDRELRIEAVTPDGATGSLTEHFNAAGFGPGCDPNTVPPFDTSLSKRRAMK